MNPSTSIRTRARKALYRAAEAINAGDELGKKKYCQEADHWNRLLQAAGEPIETGAFERCTATRDLFEE